MQIAPHGGTLVDLVLSSSDAEICARELATAQTIELDDLARADLEMIATGGYSPLEGFMSETTWNRVTHDMRLSDGLPWTLPINLTVTPDVAQKLKVGERARLVDAHKQMVGCIDVTSLYERDVRVEAQHVFGTTDTAHPGVAQLYARGAVCVAGPVKAFPNIKGSEFANRYLTPKETRAQFAQRGWQRVVGFQTRNPVHRAHEYIVKCALESVDGLLLHPLVGATKADDIPARVRMQCYETLLETSFPKATVILATLPAPMRYAGPREAIVHALIRKNYGCTHFIVGRDHAGVGSYYGTYDAQKMFDKFEAADIGIEPLRFENTFHCKSCGQLASSKTCPHAETERLMLSGTQVRDMLRQGVRPPPEFTRPAVADALIEWAKA